MINVSQQHTNMINNYAQHKTKQQRTYKLIKEIIDENNCQGEFPTSVLFRHGIFSTSYGTRQGEIPDELRIRKGKYPKSSAIQRI